MFKQLEKSLINFLSLLKSISDFNIFTAIDRETRTRSNLNIDFPIVVVIVTNKIWQFITFVILFIPDGCTRKGRATINKVYIVC